MGVLYEVEIFTPNKMINVKGKLIRSPVKFITDNIDKTKMDIKLQGILRYKITKQKIPKVLKETIPMSIEDNKKAIKISEDIILDF